ncbi:MAG: heavy-metal-associated domain-containing protein, partial [Thermomicrobiales bacterium]
MSERGVATTSAALIDDETTTTTVIFDVNGMDCGDCARSVERAVAALPGVADARVNFGAATLTVEPVAEANAGLATAV